MERGDYVTKQKKGYKRLNVDVEERIYKDFSMICMIQEENKTDIVRQFVEGYIEEYKHLLPGKINPVK